MNPLKVSEKSELFFILVGWLVDGTGDQIRKNMVIESSNGLIISIKSAEQYKIWPKNIIDYSEYTFLPGLVDSHVHLALSGTDDPEFRKGQNTAPFHEAEKVISGNLEEHLKHGIVAVRDAGDRACHALRYRREKKETVPVTTRLPGVAWYSDGRYGDFIGQVPPESLAKSISKAHRDMDHVKIINSGINSLKNFGKETDPQFDYIELSEAVRVCKKMGLKTMVHANGKKAVRASIEAGCDSIEHGYLMGKDNLRMMAEKQIFWIPTLFPMKVYTKILRPGSIESDNAERYLDHQMEQLINAHRYGVPVAVGTDAGSIGVYHGQAVKEEIKLFISLGLSFAESIRCASVNGAKLIGLDNEIGKLAPGFPSTFLLSKGAPEFFFDSSHPEMIFIKGKKKRALKLPKS